jgi:hypothetical protein
VNDVTEFLNTIMDSEDEEDTDEVDFDELES